jgi:hypothetical protein
MRFAIITLAGILVAWCEQGRSFGEAEARRKRGKSHPGRTPLAVKVHQNGLAPPHRPNKLFRYTVRH